MMPRKNYSQAEKDALLNLYKRFEETGHHLKFGIKKELANIMTRMSSRRLYEKDINNMLDEMYASGDIGQHHARRHTETKKDEGKASFQMAMAKGRVLENIRRYGLKREETIKKHVTTTAFFSDQHAGVGLSNERFRWAGNFIAEVQPDNVVSGGDWCNWDCFSGHEKAGTVKYAQKPTFPEEFAVFQESMDTLMSVIKGYDGNLYHTHGNHEERIWTHENLNPVNGDMFSSQVENEFQKHGWLTSPYGAHGFVDGMKFTHNDLSVMGKAMSKQQIIRETDCDQGTGHTHTLVNDFVKRSTGTYRVLKPGCFLPHAYRPKYSPNSDDWWYGLMLITHCQGAVIAVKEISMLELESEYA
jgi:hypothetical protein